jgi:hypothetical protein
MTDVSPRSWSQLGLNLLITAGGLLVALILLEVLLRFLGPGHLYRTPDDMLATFDYRLGYGHYKPRRQGEMIIPFGDLVAIDQITRPAIAEPRRVRYHIDSAGFRNDSDYNGEKLILVGDSFIAGSGGTQEDILSNQLKRDYGISAYNLAFPGKLHSYMRYVQVFFQTHPCGPRVLMFFFEGNKFPLPKPGGATKTQSIPSIPSALEIARKELQQSFKELWVYRYVFSFYHLLNKSLRPDVYPKVTVMKLQGSDHLSMGFLNEYMAVTRRASYDAGEEFQLRLASIKDHPGGIFFIPTKFRVSYNLLEGGPWPPLPNAQWEYLQATAAGWGSGAWTSPAPSRRNPSGSFLRAN